VADGKGFSECGLPPVFEPEALPGKRPEKLYLQVDISSDTLWIYAQDFCGEQ